MPTKVTVAAAATQNTAADATKLNIANADKVYAVHGLHTTRRNQFGDVVLVAPESLIPRWVEDNVGNLELRFTNTYVLDITRLLAVLYKEPGFGAYWENRKEEATTNATLKANEILLGTFVGNKVEVDKDVKTAILQNANANASRIESTKMYTELLNNIVFDGKFIPLEIDEEYTYADGTKRQYMDTCTVAFDFTVRISPALRKKLAAWVVAKSTDAVAELDTEDWQ